ncbi:MAG: hypothetical protein R3C13_14350 [Hyphomonas sp.]|uniref:hypothetical protein n=1 Tax=Hyphomonas sp. TaxID=87 RepID=UPI0035289C11
MKRTLTAAALPLLALALSACETDLGQYNPLATRAPAEPAVTAPAEPAAPAEEPDVLPSEAIDYDMPVGGPNTISLSVTSCLDGCPVVNVLLDPDNYWQRTAEDGVISGQGRDGLYDDVGNTFQSQGFYAFQGTLDILEGNPSTCPDYYDAGQIFFINLARNSASRRINFDSACGGSASADGAADAINTLVSMRDFMDIVSGTVPEEDTMGDEE